MAREQLSERISAPALFVQFSKAINWKEESLLGQNVCSWLHYGESSFVMPCAAVKVK